MLDTKTASTLTLAREMLRDLDRARPQTTMATPTLELLLETLLEFWPDHPAGETAKRTVMGYAANLAAAGEAELEQQAARAEVRY